MFFKKICNYFRIVKVGSTTDPTFATLLFFLQNVVEYRLESIGGTLQSCAFFIAELDRNLSLNAVLSDNRGHTERDAVDFLRILYARYRQDRFLVTDNRFADALYRHRDAVVGRLFALYDLVGAVLDLLGDSARSFFLVEMSAHVAELEERNARYIRAAPRGDLAVAVLADYEGVDTSAVNPEVLAEQILQSRGIENGSRAKHAVRGISAELFRNVGQDIDGIRDYEKNARTVVLGYFRNNRLEDRDVLLDQIESCFTRLLTRARGDNYDGGVADVLISARLNLHGL